MFKTGHFCPISSSYTFVKHTDDSACMLKHKEIIYVDAKKNFPPAKECGYPAFWVLLPDD